MLQGVTVRGSLVLAGLVLAVGVSYGLLRWVESSLRQPSPVDDREPVLVAEQVRAVRLNMAGQREYVVEAPGMAQLPGQQGTRVEQPTMDWYQPDGRTREWRVQSERGWVAADHQVVRLEGKVVMTRLAESGKPPVTITTRDVLIRPAERYAETAAPARAVTPGGEMQSVGLQAFLNEERLELLSEVRGVYEPPKR
ncbi:MAG TPA: LPS export ABC transporter periplasmic protein LptC [Candidatus Competibacteraceae bacterium]|nr:MAG: LPS export ABC transporter periplasmic protein LptC [Candidatus Competibacteraceae bacterium]HOB60533.1 LPS export ABC transporter periplasmic protein LptC [Candidatus Competibacteraceae bacterium]HQA24655.1 LPS export ABC transporter periplasmic protein LptC [Candidatus Competibacteraceae bacterium]HQD54904.1 LPS export ABC transporter periplasmic protein LptC [Candidatus Competibacteraceae bacterium]